MGEANFLSSNCFEITFHVSCCKWAPPSDLPSYWALNLPSMLNYIDSIHQGIYGLVRDKEGNPVKGAIVHVKGKVHWVKTTEDGEYWRLLVPGLYNVTVHPSASFIMETKLVNLTEDNRYVQLDFLLERPSFYGYVVNTDSGKPIKEGTIMYKKIEENRRVEDPRTFKRPCYIHINEGEFGDTLAPGTYNITVIVLGYKKENTIVTINEKEPVELNFSLNRRGVFGTVTNENNMPLKEAVIKVLSKDSTIHKTDNRTGLSSVPAVSSNFRKLETKTDENGEYWLILESGNYNISVTAPGYKHQYLTLMIQDSECQHFRLQQQDYFQGVEAFIFKAKSRTPLRGTIRISNTKENIVLKSDVNRMFRRYLDIGYYEIEASAHGYKTQIKDISIKKKSLYSVEFYLLPPIKKGKVS